MKEIPGILWNTFSFPPVVYKWLFLSFLDQKSFIKLAPSKAAWQTKTTWYQQSQIKHNTEKNSWLTSNLTFITCKAQIQITELLFSQGVALNSYNVTEVTGVKIDTNLNHMIFALLIIITVMELSLKIRYVTILCRSFQTAASNKHKHVTNSLFFCPWIDPDRIWFVRMKKERLIWLWHYSTIYDLVRHPSLWSFLL